jgi:malate permease and related proteins
VLSVIGASFLATLAALVQIALVIGTSAFLVRRKVFDENHIRALSGIVVNLSLPCLVFSSIIRDFSVVEYPDWWKFPLMGILTVVVVLPPSWFLFRDQREHGRALSALTTFQNAGYLVLPIGEVLFPDQFHRFSIYLFLLLLTYNPLLWSIGSFLISHRKGSRFRLGQVITTPFVATLAAMFLVFTGLRSWTPGIFVNAVELVGRSCVPLATVVLGLTIGSLHVQRMPSAYNIARVALIKLVAVPVLMFAVLKYTSLSSSPLENAFWMLEMASPPATGLALQAVHFGGDEHLVCGILVSCYIIAMLTMPLFFSLAQVLL